MDRKEEWERVKKMTLYELQRSNFLVYCDDTLLIGHGKVELEEEEEEDVFEGDVNSNNERRRSDEGAMSGDAALEVDLTEED